MAGYTRQSTSQIINGANITAPPLNAEFNQLASSFGVTGHTHDGTSGNAPKIDLATSVTGYLPATNGGTGGKNNLAATTNPGNGDDADDGYSRGSYWYNYTGDRWYICINNTVGSAVWREMLMVETGSVIEPGITGAVDLGSTTFKFKDTHLSGSMNSVSAAIYGNMTVGGTQTNTGAATFNGSATFNNITNFNGASNTIANAAITSGTINGTTIGGATAAAGTFTALTANNSANLTNATISGGTINNSVIGGTTPLNITGLTVAASTGFSGDLTGNVLGNVTGNLTGTVNATGGVIGDVTGNVTASSGSSTFNNVVINGSLDMDATTASTITGLSTPVNPTDAATRAYVDQKVALVLSSAPAALDTLNELAAAINDDANFATTVNSSIATKLSLSGGTMTGNIDLDSTNKITNMPTPSANSDGSNKGYVDTQRDTRLATIGGTMSGAINMNSQAITSLANPANSGDAANKFYVDSILGSATSAAASASTASALAAQASGSAANAQASEDEAQEWATKTTGTITGESEYSAKEYAIGTVIRGNIGSAKDWSTYTGGTVDGTNYSAKYWATNANIGTIASNIDDLVNVANDLSSGNFVAGQIYDFGAITDAATGTSGAPDGFIVTVANNLADVQTVSNVITNVNTVAGISANVTTVAGVSSAVSTLAAISSDVSAVAPIAANVTTVAGVSSDVTAVANNNANINTVVGQITPNNNISTLASIAGNISTVASVSVDVTTVAGISSNVTAVANNNANVTSVANIDSDVTAVAGIASDVTTAATNVTDITNFADVYQGPKSSAPTQRNNNSSLVAGDLYFDTTSGFMRYYSGSSWVNITAPTGDMGNQNSTSVAITGGSITGITDLEIADGGTGASSAPAARTNLGLDTMATQAANNVAITGGTISVDFDFGSI